MRHVVFKREQLLSIAKQLEEFEDILMVDFQFTHDGEPLRVEYIWDDEDES